MRARPTDSPARKRVVPLQHLRMQELWTTTRPIVMYCSNRACSSVATHATTRRHLNNTVENNTLSVADNTADVEYSGYGALYKKLMSAWIHSEQQHQTEQFLAAAYVYAFEDHEANTAICDAFGSTSSIEADDKLVGLMERYRNYQQQPGFSASPFTVRYSVSAKQPYKNYDLETGELVLHGHRWKKRADLADGRRGIDFAPCKRMLGLPGVAQAGSATPVPEHFDLNIQDYVTTLNSHRSANTFNTLTRVKMDRNRAAALLEQGKSASLNIGVSVQLVRNRAANTSRTHFTATQLTINATDELTGESVYKIDLSSADDSDIPDYVIPRSAPEGSGLPDNLAFHQGSIVLYPSNIINKLGTTPHTQLALRQLQQKLLLQNHPGLARDKNAATWPGLTQVST